MDRFKYFMQQQRTHYNNLLLDNFGNCLHYVGFNNSIIDIINHKLYLVIQVINFILSGLVFLLNLIEKMVYLIKHFLQRYGKIEIERNSNNNQYAIIQEGIHNEDEELERAIMESLRENTLENINIDNSYQNNTNHDNILLNSEDSDNEDPLENALLESFDFNENNDSEDEETKRKRCKYIKERNFKRCDKDNNCTICLEPLNSEKKVGELKCKHAFHYECIKKWVHVSPECPICKNNIKRKPQHLKRGRTDNDNTTRRRKRTRRN